MNFRFGLALVLIVFICMACGLPAQQSTNALPSNVKEIYTSNPESSRPPTLSLVSKRSSASVLNVERTSAERPLFRGPNGNRLISGRSGNKSVSGDDRYYFETLRSPDGEKWLIHHGSGNYAIYYANGDWFIDVPSVTIEDAEAISWQWKNTLALVGVAGITRPAPLPRYPDGDVLPEATQLFLYRPYEQPETLYLLQTVEPPPGTVIRLEGVTEDGGLLLSAVKPTEYFGGPAEEMLGVFDVSDP